RKQQVLGSNPSVGSTPSFVLTRSSYLELPRSSRRPSPLEDLANQRRTANWRQQTPGLEGRQGSRWRSAFLANGVQLAMIWAGAAMFAPALAPSAVASRSVLGDNASPTTTTGSPGAAAASWSGSAHSAIRRPAMTT